MLRSTVKVGRSNARNVEFERAPNVTTRLEFVTFLLLKTVSTKNVCELNAVNPFGSIEVRG